MANLVSPGYKRSSLVNSILAPEVSRIIEFRGLNRKDSVSEGEMSDMKNLSSDKYPLLAPRKLRAKMTGINPAGPICDVISKNGALVVYGTHGDFGGGWIKYKGDLLDIDGTDKTRLVGINNKICLFPEGRYVKLVIDEEGESSIDLTDPQGVLAASYEFSEQHRATVTISNEDVRIVVPNTDFKYDDALNIAGTLYYTPSGGTATSKACNVSCIVEQAIVDTSVTPRTTTLVLPRETFIELTGEGMTEPVTFAGTLTREIPHLDIVIEWNNRLWGASNKTNTIYACKLGDPTNWHYFQGTSLDSYYAEQGSEGKWTGAAVYSGHLIFFKENSMTRIYGSSPQSWQIGVTECYGVEDGSSRSVCVINDRIIYKSSIGIMVYDGGIPYRISENLATTMQGVVCGSDGMKCYISYDVDEDTSELAVLDLDKGLWHKEDDLRFRCTCKVDNRLHVVSDKAREHFEENAIYIINPDTPTEKIGDRDWYAVFGPFDEYVENKKIYSKISFRLVAKTKAKVSVYIKTDEEEVWELVNKYEFAGTGGNVAQILPRRCDRFSIKVAGVGDVEIKSLARRYRAGSEVRE